MDGWARKSKGQRTGQAGEELVKRLSRTGMVGVEIEKYIKGGREVD